MAQQQIIQVSEEKENIRLDAFLASQIEDLSRAYIQDLIKNESILVNGKKSKSSYKVSSGDEIQINRPMLQELEVVAEDIPINIVYEDKDFIIINKDQDMVVHPAPGNETGTLVNALLHHSGDSLSGINGVKRPGIVHRIDKNTTGLLVVCKNDTAHRSIAEQLKVHSITRKYQAIVYNNIKEDSGTVNAPIGRHPVNRKKMAINCKNGKEAVTHFTVLQRFGNYTLIEAQLETGRTHQIRVHMASIGHPLLGDEVYGPKKKQFNLQGQVLHAKTLGFIHPTSKEYVEFNSDLPPYFCKLIKILEKNN